MFTVFTKHLSEQDTASYYCLFINSNSLLTQTFVINKLANIVIQNIN